MLTAGEKKKSLCFDLPANIRRMDCPIMSFGDEYLITYYRLPHPWITHIIIARAFMLIRAAFLGIEYDFGQDSAIVPKFHQSYPPPDTRNLPSHCVPVSDSPSRLDTLSISPYLSPSLPRSLSLSHAISAFHNTHKSYANHLVTGGLSRFGTVSRPIVLEASMGREGSGSNPGSERRI